MKTKILIASLSLIATTVFAQPPTQTGAVINAQKAPGKLPSPPPPLQNPVGASQSEAAALSEARNKAHEMAQEMAHEMAHKAQNDKSQVQEVCMYGCDGLYHDIPPTQ